MGRLARVVVPGYPHHVKDWRRYLQGTDDDELARSLRRHEATGRPLGNETFLHRL